MGKKKRLNSEGETFEKQRELGKTIKFHVHDLISFRPLTDNQKSYFEAHFSQAPIIFQDGPAGTGKTAISIYCSLKEIFDGSTPFQKLVMIRSAVDTREQGFVPGTQEEKDSEYEEAYSSIIDELIETYDHSYQNLKAKNYYEFRTTGRLRGLTLSDCIVIVDECQNCNYKELRSIVTRLGHNAKIVFCGDFRQSDLKGGKRDTSGFNLFKQVLNNMSSSNVAFIDYTLEDIVRSGIVKDFLVSDYQICQE